MVWVTLGNIVSGAGIMGLGYWAMSRPKAAASVKLAPVGDAAD